MAIKPKSITEANDPATTTLDDYGTRLGLTKLEYFSALALQGLLASGVMHVAKEEAARLAVGYAKSLVQVLNE